jgi:hypothetical protein
MGMSTCIIIIIITYYCTFPVSSIIYGRNVSVNVVCSAEYTFSSLLLMLKDRTKVERTCGTLFHFSSFHGVMLKHDDNFTFCLSFCAMEIMTREQRVEMDH